MNTTNIRVIPASGNRYGLAAIKPNEKVTTPFMFELSFSNLAEGSNYSPWLNLSGNSSSSNNLTGGGGSPSLLLWLKNINDLAPVTEKAVANALENPTKNNLDKLVTDSTYGSMYGNVSQFLMVLDQRFAGVQSGLFSSHGSDPFYSENIQSAQKELQNKLDQANWDVVYFQYVKFGTIDHNGHPFIDSATMLIAVIPKQNGKPVTPIVFNDLSTSSYGLSTWSVVRIVAILAASAFLAWALTPIAVTAMDAFKALPPLPITALSIGEMAIMGLGALALVMLIFSGKKKT